MEATMKIVGLEEHIAMPQLLDAWSRVPGIVQIPELGYGDARHIESVDLPRAKAPRLRR